MTNLNKTIIFPFILILGGFLLHPVASMAAIMVYSPSLSELGQFKSDNLTEIEKSGITTEDVIIFQAKVSSPYNNRVKLQIEIKEFSQSFDESDILESNFANSGDIASVARHGLINGKYHWRARAVDEYGEVSDWQEFSETGNVDFEVKLVPLYTQVVSDYPSQIDTAKWAGEIYANGRGTTGPNPCGLQIKDCGCAITSTVMLLRYHGVTSAVDNQDVNPLTFNTWLNNNNGYLTAGNLNWPKAAEYSKTSPTGFARIRYDGRKDFTDAITLNFYLTSLNPVIIYNNTFGHFLVADGELSDTYTIKDPAWYGTKKLDEETTDITNKIRDYNNQFAGLRLYSPLVSGGPVDGISITLASPAELLVTDSLGRRLGKYPSINISYNEIPGGSYGQEGIGNTDAEVPILVHEVKNIWIPQPAAGEYTIKVIGTDTGVYTLESLVYDSQSQPHSQTLTGATQQNLITNYILNFTPDNPKNIILKPSEQAPPEAKIYFDKDSKILKVEGIDDISQTFVEKQGNDFVIKDESDNSLIVSFNNLKQNKKEIKAELESLQYNSEPVIELPKTELKFEWSIDTKTQQIKELGQKIKVKNQFEIQAKYNSKKDETVISIKEDNKKEAKQTLTGLVIIKLTTKSGSLGFEF